MLLHLAALILVLWIAIILLGDPDGFRRSSRRTISKHPAAGDAHRQDDWFKCTTGHVTKVARPVYKSSSVGLRDPAPDDGDGRFFLRLSYERRMPVSMIAGKLWPQTQAGDCIMTKGKRNLSTLELRMRTFQVRPEWYEEYWLQPDDAPSAGKRRLRWSTAMYAALAAAVLSAIGTFIGT